MDKQKTDLQKFENLLSLSVKLLRKIRYVEDMNLRTYLFLDKISTLFELCPAFFDIPTFLEDDKDNMDKNKDKDKEKDNIHMYLNIIQSEFKSIMDWLISEMKVEIRENPIPL